MPYDADKTRAMPPVGPGGTASEQTTKINIGVTASGPDADGSLGMISRLFGSEAGQNARVLDVPVLSDTLIEDADMVVDDS